MPKNRNKQQAFQSIFMKWLPVVLAGIILFTVPPVAIAVIIAYSTAPILSSVRSMTKFPLTFATLFVMTLMLFLIIAFTFIAIHGIIDTVPTVEHHIAPFTQNTDIPRQIIHFLEEKVVEYGHALLEYTLTIISTVFQQLFSLFIFLVAYFFALRESGKNRYWFLVYFPVTYANQQKECLQNPVN